MICYVPRISESGPGAVETVSHLYYRIPFPEVVFQARLKRNEHFGRLPRPIAPHPYSFCTAAAVGGGSGLSPQNGWTGGHVVVTGGDDDHERVDNGREGAEGHEMTTRSASVFIAWRGRVT